MRINDFKVGSFYARYEISTPFMLSFSDVESLPIKELLSLEKSAFDTFINIKLGYTELQGFLSLVMKIGTYFRRLLI